MIKLYNKPVKLNKERTDTVLGLDIYIESFKYNEHNHVLKEDYINEVTREVSIHDYMIATLEQDINDEMFEKAKKEVIETLYEEDSHLTSNQDTKSLKFDIETLQKSELIQRIENDDSDTIVEMFESSIFISSPFVEMKEKLYYRKRNDIVDYMREALDKDGLADVKNITYYLIDKNVLNRLFNILKKAIKYQKAQGEIDPIESYYLDEFKALNQNKEYLFYIWY